MNLLVASLPFLASLPFPGLDAPAVATHPMDGPDVELHIYLEESALRLVLAPNLAYLDETVDVLRESPDIVHPVEFEALTETILEHAKEKLYVAIDGVEVAPVPAGFELLEANEDHLALFPNFGRLALTRVEYTLEYPLKAAPDRFEITWPEFPDDPQKPRGDGTFEPLEINGRLFADSRESLVQFSRRDPRYLWLREEAERTAEPLPVPPPFESRPGFPVASLLAVLAAGAVGFSLQKRAPFAALGVLVLGGGLALVLRPGTEAGYAVPDDAQALAAFTPIHANLYRAFDYTEESAIYDALAKSAEGDLLDSIYQEVVTSLVLEEDGGATSFVRSVDLVEPQVLRSGHYPPDDAAGFEVDTRWNVEGQVFHWGHSHTRTNRYRAKYLVVATSEGWRLRSSEVLEHERERDANDTDDFPAPAVERGEYEDL